MLRRQVGYHDPAAMMTELIVLSVFDVPKHRPCEKHGER